MVCVWFYVRYIRAIPQTVGRHILDRRFLFVQQQHQHPKYTIACFTLITKHYQAVKQHGPRSLAESCFDKAFSFLGHVRYLINCQYPLIRRRVV